MTLRDDFSQREKIFSLLSWTQEKILGRTSISLGKIFLITWRRGAVDPIDDFSQSRDLFLDSEQNFESIPHPQKANVGKS